MINRKALILKAAIAAVTAIAITFIQVHNGMVGLIAVLSFATGILAGRHDLSDRCPQLRFTEC
ncbi:MAG: hypothetical protein RLZZ576_945 [Actinomycetota bacterium]